MASIVPVAKALYLCDYHVGYASGKIDLYGVFKAIQPKQYPFRKGPFVCFFQLIGGLGTVNFHIDVRRASDMKVLDWSGTRTLQFPDRDTLVQVAWTFPGCTFGESGLYFVELYCDNTWVTDTTLKLREIES